MGWCVRHGMGLHLVRLIGVRNHTGNKIAVHKHTMEEILHMQAGWKVLMVSGAVFERLLVKAQTRLIARMQLCSSSVVLDLRI